MIVLHVGGRLWGYADDPTLLWCITAVIAREERERNKIFNGDSTMVYQSEDPKTPYPRRGVSDGHSRRLYQS